MVNIEKNTPRIMTSANDLIINELHNKSKVQLEYMKNHVNKDNFRKQVYANVRKMLNFAWINGNVV